MIYELDFQKILHFDNIINFSLDKRYSALIFSSRSLLTPIKCFLQGPINLDDNFSKSSVSLTSNY
jgi:hypothetical protein